MPFKKKKIKNLNKPTKNKRKSIPARKASDEEYLNKNQEEPVASKEDLENLLDNYGHCISEPLLAERTNQIHQQPPPKQQHDGSSSVIELSLRKVVYKECPKHHQTNVDPTNKFPCAADSTHNDISAEFARECGDLLSGSSPCLCEFNNLCNTSTDECLCNLNIDDSVCTDLQGYAVCKQCNRNNFDCDCQLQQQQPQQKQPRNVDNLADVKGDKQYKDEIQGLNQERIDRYNLNHIQYSRTHPIARNNSSRWSWLSFWNGRRNNKKKYQNNLKYAAAGNNGQDISSSSGVTIPQLYKANVCNTTGITPEKFTFRAVTGCPQWFDTSDTNNLKPNKYSNKNNESIHKDNKISKYKTKNAAKEKKLLLLDENLQKTDKNMTKHVSRLKGEQVAGMAGMHEYVVTRAPPERIDIYCFDHLNTCYFRTSDHPPPLISDIAMERVETHATRFWAEIFGFIHLFVAFVIAFILQFYKFLLYALIRPLMVGIPQLTSDYFFKPLLTVIYNSLTQPFCIFVYNIATSFRDVCLPIAKGIGYFITEFATILKAIRLVEWKPTTIIGATSTKHNVKNV